MVAVGETVPLAARAASAFEVLFIDESGARRRHRGAGRRQQQRQVQFAGMDG